MAERKENQEPIRRRVYVDCPIEDAFRLFTQHLAEWWPFADDCAIEPWIGGRLQERTGSGEERNLATVTVWEPPERIAFDWHSEPDSGASQSVEILFRTDAYGTEVILTHLGWETTGIQASATMGAFARFVCEQITVMA
jgi:uncharacterized protein YndB with AHSA1/START domain